MTAARDELVREIDEAIRREDACEDGPDEQCLETLRRWRDLAALPVVDPEQVRALAEQVETQAEALESEVDGSHEQRLRDRAGYIHRHDAEDADSCDDAAMMSEAADEFAKRDYQLRTAATRIATLERELAEAREKADAWQESARRHWQRAQAAEARLAEAREDAAGGKRAAESQNKQWSRECRRRSDECAAKEAAEAKLAKWQQWAESLIDPENQPDGGAMGDEPARQCIADEVRYWRHHPIENVNRELREANSRQMVRVRDAEAKLAAVSQLVEAAQLARDARVRFFAGHCAVVAGYEAARADYDAAEAALFAAVDALPGGQG
jgi:DNA repair exonuclease SbcCD ATPase subunit